MTEGAIWFVVGILDVFLAAGVTLHAILWKREHGAAIAWVGLAWLAPIVGSAAYFFFGINRIERKAKLLRSRRTTWGAGRRGAGRAPNPPDPEPGSCLDTLSGLATAVREVTELEITPGNSVRPLRDGDEAFPAMLEAIDGAGRSVSLLSYIFDRDRTGTAFAKALGAAHRRGVEVRVLVDAIGARYSRPTIVGLLREEGVHAATFLPTRLPRLPRASNLRNHRKILVVDGAVGFTGGTNIRDGHRLSLSPESPTPCLHFELRGPVVGHLQRAFATDWAFTESEFLDGEIWFPDLSPAGSVWARGIEDGPDEDFENLSDVLASALAVAKERVRIATPYFLPPRSLATGLNVAALRGVEVEIYLPATNNVPLVQWATTAQLWQLLEKGCRIYRLSGAFDHTKLMTVDDCWALIGSTNWDPRSLRLNFEFNVECYSAELAGHLNRILDEKTADARPVTLEDVRRRGLAIRLRDGLARLLTPYL